MKKTFLKIAMLAAVMLAVHAESQVNQFAQPTYLTVTTNSGTLVMTVTTVQVPAISLTITATNSATIVTNTIFNGLTVGAATIPSTVFIYNAATMGINFSTNWPPYSISVTNYTFGQAAPQSGGSNTCYIK